MTVWLSLLQNTEYWILLSHTRTLRAHCCGPHPQALAPHRASPWLGISTWGHCKPREAKLGWFSFLPTHSSSFFLHFLLWFVTPSFIHAISQARKLRAVLRCPFSPLGNPCGHQDYPRCLCCSASLGPYLYVVVLVVLQ